MVNARPDPARDDSSESRPPKAPRWVKVSAIVVGIVILVFLITQLTGTGGQHGPGRHNAAQPVSMATAQASGVG